MGLRIVLVLGFLLALASCTKNKPSNEIVLGFNPAENVDTVETNGILLAKKIEEKTGLKLKIFVASDYGALVESMRSNQVHLAFLSGFSLVQAEKIAGAKVLLKAVRAGHPFYHSAIITAKNYKSIQDLKGKTIAWTDPASASGHIMAKSSLMDMGIDPDTFFSKQVFAGAHDALVLAVLNKTVDAGASLSNNDTGTDAIWHQYLKSPEDRERLKQIRILHISKPVPGDTLSTTQKFYDANKGTVDKITEMLLSFGKTAEGKKILFDLYHIQEMVPAKSEEYEPLRAAAKRLNIGIN